MKPSLLLATAFAVCGLSACGDTAVLSPDESVGPNPKLPPPNETLIPTLKIAPAVGWPQGA
jgi:hypothetical protein